MIKLKELLKPKPKFVGVIAAYVNEFEDKGLVAIKDEVPSNLKYSGEAYHICPFSKKDIQAVLDGKTIPYPPKKVLSWSVTTGGIIEVKQNLEADSPGKFNNALVLKQKITKDKCIVDVEAFIDKYEGAISDTQYADYESEEEVITINFLTKLDKTMLDGYFLDGKGTEYNK